MQISGKITDKKTNETIVGAVVFKSDALGKSIGGGTASDVNGNYSLSNLASGDFITAQIIGKKPLTQKVSGSTLNFSLDDSGGTSLGTFEVVESKPEPKPQSPPKDKLNKWIISFIALSVISLTAFAIYKTAKK